MRVLDVELGLAGPAFPVAVGAVRSDLASGWMTFSDGGAGRPAALSKIARSLATVGEPYESTMTIVWPLPVIPLA